MYDLFSEARKHAAQVREMYDAYVSAGFSAEEAFTLAQIFVRAILSPM